MRVALFLVCVSALARAEAPSPSPAPVDPVDEDRAEAERQLTAGARLLEQGQPDKARLRYEMAARLSPDDPRTALGFALADSALHKCERALKEVDEYLRREHKPDPRALTVLSRCPRNAPVQPPAQSSAAPPPQTKAPPPPHKPRGRLFLVDLEAGLNIPLTSDSLHVDFLGTLEVGVALSNRLGLDLVWFFESLVSRAAVQAGTTALQTVFTENFVLGVEERRVVWRHLSVFGTLGLGISVDSFQGFRKVGVLHADVGLGWEIGPGEIRLRPLDFSMVFDATDFGASWRASAGYAFRF